MTSDQEPVPGQVPAPRPVNGHLDTKVAYSARVKSEHQAKAPTMAWCGVAAKP
jgi:hypothetical protein